MLGSALAVADIVKIVALTVHGINHSEGIRQFAAVVVEVGIRVRRIERRADLLAGDAATRSVIGVDVLRDRTGGKSVLDLKQFATIPVGPRSCETVRICER